jgi:hypothetical protein
MMDSPGNTYNQKKGWSYRVFSELWTCPDETESGRRRLTLRDDEEAVPDGHSVEEVEVCLERTSAIVKSTSVLDRDDG